MGLVLVKGISISEKGGNPMKDVWTSDIEEAINEYYGGQEK